MCCFPYVICWQNMTAQKLQKYEIGGERVDNLNGIKMDMQLLLMTISGYCLQCSVCFI